MLDIDIGNDVKNNITFLPKRNNNKPSISNNKWDNEFRTETRIGRLLRKVGYNDDSNNNINTIETYISEYKKIKQLFHLEIVKGKDIRFWYNCNNYEPGGGQLNNSCMRHAEMNYKFNLYVDNPEVCSMLIMKYDEKSTKIIGRALIWETDKGTYMDRVYTKNDADKKLFEEYAKDKKWKSYGEADFMDRLVIKIKKSSKKEKKSTFTQYINFFKKNKSEKPYSSKYPFMDTFKYYYYEDGELTNKLDTFVKKKIIGFRKMIYLDVAH